MIDVYIAELDAVLRGPRRAKADLIDEARDSLIDVADAYRLHGMDRLAAERKAVEEFGSVAEIAPQYQAELRLSQSRRTALLIAVVLVLQPVIWEYGPPLIGVSQIVDQEPGYEIVDTAVKWLGSGAIVVALLVAAACGLGQRYVDLPGWLIRVAGVFGIAVAVVFTTTGGLLGLLGTSGSWFTSGDLLSLLAFLVLPLSWVAVSARRCLALA